MSHETETSFRFWQTQQLVLRCFKGDLGVLRDGRSIWHAAEFDADIARLIEKWRRGRHIVANCRPYQCIEHAGAGHSARTDKQAVENGLAASYRTTRWEPAIVDDVEVEHEHTVPPK